MQVFKLFMKILKSKLFTAMMYFIAVVALCIGFTLGGSADEKFESSKLNICVTDLDNTPQSKALAGYIAKKHNIVEPDMDLKDALFFTTADYSLTIKEGYADKLLSDDTEGMIEGEYVHSSYSAAYMGSFLDEYISCVRACAAGGDDIDTAIAKAEEALSEETEVTMISAEAGSSNGIESGKGFFRYLPYTMIMVMITALSPVIMSINSKEVRFRTNCSSTSPVSFIAQVILGSLVFVFFLWLVCIIIGIPFGGGMYEGIGWLKVLNSAVFAVIAAFLAVLVSMLISSEKSITIVSNILGLGMSFLCGIFFSQSMLSDSVLAVGKFLPAFWYIKLNDMLTGATAYNSDTAMQCLLIEAGFAAAIGALTMLLYKVKVRSND